MRNSLELSNLTSGGQPQADVQVERRESLTINTGVFPAVLVPTDVPDQGRLDQNKPKPGVVHPVSTSLADCRPPRLECDPRANSPTLLILSCCTKKGADPIPHVPNSVHNRSRRKGVRTVSGPCQDPIVFVLGRPRGRVVDSRPNWRTIFRTSAHRRRGSPRDASPQGRQFSFRLDRIHMFDPTWRPANGPWRQQCL